MKKYCSLKVNGVHYICATHHKLYVQKLVNGSFVGYQLFLSNCARLLGPYLTKRCYNYGIKLKNNWL